MPQLALHLLGPPRIERDGEPVEISRRKAIALLVYLAVAGPGPGGKSHSRDALATLLWPESDQSRARAGLRRALAALKKALRQAQDAALGEGWLDVDRETVALSRDAQVWLDVTEFRDRLAECGMHGHPQEETCPACLSLLAEAVELYRDDFLAGFTLRDAPAFDDWQFFQTEGLRDELAKALQRLAYGYGDRGEYESAIACARRWLALDPLCEPAHLHLMRLYARSGQRAAALRQYGECERVLKEELGVPPQEETTLVYEAAKENRELPPLAAPAAPQTTARRHNLPIQLTPFVGRETLLAEIAERLKDPDCRLLTLVGPGGSGKTRLALEVGAAQLDNYTHGVWFVSLAPLRSVDAIVPTVADALGFRFYEEELPQQQLLDYLRQKNLLLIMDNYEHLLEGVGLVTEILKTAPEVKVLATSRARLNVGGEHRFQITGMDFPKLPPKVPADAVQYSAVKLFLQGARRAQPGFELTDENLRGVIDVCRVVEGLPLAIRLAAAWVEVLAPDEIAAEISQGIDFLETNLRDVPERQRSMRAVFDHSWHLLTPRERGVMQALSVFRGGFTREAAQEVTGASLRELMALVNKSLLQRTPTGQYELHELLRQYAADKLETLGEANAARDAHSAYYAGFLHRREADLMGRRQLGALNEIEADFENARVAWNWALRQKDYVTIGQLLNGLIWFCFYRSRNLEYAELFEQAWALLAPGPDSEPHPVWARILAAEFYAKSREVDRAQIERSLAIAQAHDHQKLANMCLRILGEIAFDAGEYAEALRLYEKSLAYFRDSGDSFYVAAVLYELAETYRLLGQPEEAIKFARQSLDLSREIGDRFWAASSLANTGVIALYTGNYTEAEDYLREANTIYREMGYIEGIASSSMDLGKLAFLKADFEKGKALAEEALEIATDTGNKRVARYAGSLALDVAKALGEKAPGEKIDEHPDEEELTPMIDIPPTIDRFEVKELLGATSLSSVYLAYDPDNGRDVAIKMANPEALRRSDRASRMFNYEAEVMARLAHPAFAEFYGRGETADSVYIVLQLIHGKDLLIIFEEQEEFLPEEVVIEWAIQICDALTYMHSQKPELVIFRDIKPSNVMVDHDGKVHLIDFGIVELYRPGRELPMFGTEGYSPPEQYIGYSDARSDTYALGATLHHLLTRRDPRKETPFSFHDAPPRSLNPAISEELEAVVLKAVEYKAEDRYQSAEEMKSALLACLER